MQFNWSVFAVSEFNGSSVLQFFSRIQPWASARYCWFSSCEQLLRIYYLIWTVDCRKAIMQMTVRCKTALGVPCMLFVQRTLFLVQVFPTLKVCNTWFAGMIFSTPASANNFMTSFFIKTNITYPIAATRTAISDPDISEAEIQRTTALMALVEMMNTFKPITFGVTMIREAQWYNWGMRVAAENADWNETIVYDENYVVCHYISPSKNKLTVSFY